MWSLLFVKMMEKGRKGRKGGGGGREGTPPLPIYLTAQQESERLADSEQNLHDWLMTEQDQRRPNEASFNHLNAIQTTVHHVPPVSTAPHGVQMREEKSNILMWPVFKSRSKRVKKNWPEMTLCGWRDVKSAKQNMCKKESNWDGLVRLRRRR